MADGMVVLRDGKAMQQGPPRDLYRRPANRFVADFLGESNFIDAETLSVDGGTAPAAHPRGRDAFDRVRSREPAPGRRHALGPPRGAADRRSARRRESPRRHASLDDVPRQGLRSISSRSTATAETSRSSSPIRKSLPAIGDRVRLSIDPGSVVVLPA